LKNGKHYLIANTDDVKRRKLVAYFTKDEQLNFDKELILFDADHTDIPSAIACHYPAAVEADYTLYVIATVSYNDMSFRGATLFTIDLKDI
jgi:hypothetical protein